MKIRIAVIAVLLISLVCTPVYALNILERLLYKEVLLQMYGQKVLVHRVTGEVKYIWQRPTSILIYGKSIAKDGEWIPIYDKSAKSMWQDIYNRENTR